MRLMLGALALPLIEIALFILVGGWIGVWPTLGLVALAGMAGILLLRGQGAGAMATMRQAGRPGADPAALLARGALRVLAGLLLIVPGFLTDAIALALLVPGVERLILRRLRARMPQGGATGRVQPAGAVIDAEFEEVAPGQTPTHQPSGWTRH